VSVLNCLLDCLLEVRLVPQPLEVQNFEVCFVVKINVFSWDVNHLFVVVV